MRRRRLLALVGAATTGLGGCVATGPGAGTDEPTEEPTETATDRPTDTPTETPTDQPTPRPVPEPIVLTDRSFEVTSVDCGAGESDATVSHEPLDGQAGRVRVDGVVRGRDTCYRARLVEATAGGSDPQELRVVVEPYVPDENQGRACGECIVDVGYAATVDYEGAGPFSVVVVHEGERVAEAGPYGGSRDETSG